MSETQAAVYLWGFLCFLCGLAVACTAWILVHFIELCAVIYVGWKEKKQLRETEEEAIPVSYVPCIGDKV